MYILLLTDMYFVDVVKYKLLVNIKFILKS